MRNWSICILLCVACFGCNRPSDDEVREEVRKNLEQIGTALQAYHDVSSDPTAAANFVIASEAEYYTTGPQQGRPADGKFAAGTKVTIVSDAGSYFLVRSADGVEAYVSAAAVKKQEAATNEVDDTSGGKKE